MRPDPRACTLCQRQRELRHCERCLKKCCPDCLRFVPLGGAMFGQVCARCVSDDDLAAREAQLAMGRRR